MSKLYVLIPQDDAEDIYAEIPVEMVAKYDLYEGDKTPSGNIVVTKEENTDEQ